jgi:hypothetical protein
MPPNCEFQIIRVIDGQPEFARELQGRAAISLALEAQGQFLQEVQYWRDPLAALFRVVTPFLGEHFKPGLGRAEALSILIGWLHHGTRFSAQSLLPCEGVRRLRVLN